MDKELRRITDYLLFNSSCMSDVGLFHGKMGIVISLYAYAKRYQDKLMEEFAWELFQQVYDGVNTDSPVNLEYGLAGIGYGTTLLCEWGWVECDLNAVLAEIDTKIMERDPRRMTDFSVRSGAGGLLLYLAERQKTGMPLLTFDSQYLAELQSAVTNRVVINYSTKLIGLLNAPSFAIDDYLDKPIGIDGGSAYYILKNILE